MPGAHKHTTRQPAEPDAGSRLNLYVSLIRTAVPAFVGWLVTAAASHGLGLDRSSLEGVLVPVISFGYYALFRFAEAHLSPRFGWLLGIARPPSYEPSKRPLPW